MNRYEPLFRAIATANSSLDIDRYPVSCEERRSISESLNTLFFDLAIDNGVCASFEIGAFEAGFSRKFAAAATDARVIAFEANPDIHRRFKAEVEACGVEYLNLAVSDVAENVELSIPVEIKGRLIPEFNRMSSMLRQKLESVKYRTLSVPATALDDWIARNPCDPPFAMWIDVEGAQMMVLDGASEALKRTAIILIELEHGAIWRGQSVADDVEHGLAVGGFAPVVRDIERPHQFNGLFMRTDLVEMCSNRRAIDRWWKDVSARLADMKC